jgi:hypothetical protein
MVDYNAKDITIGMELTAPEHSTVEHIDELLARLGFAATEPDELAPLRAARAPSIAMPRLGERHRSRQISATTPHAATGGARPQSNPARSALTRVR